MAKAPQAPDVTFTTDWQRRKSWAAANNIPAPVFDQTYKLAQQRLGEGLHDYTDEEAFLMMQGAKGGQALIGQANQNPGDVFGNIGHDLTSLFSGLIHVPGELVHQVQQVVHQPVLLDPFYTPDQMSRQQKNQWQAGHPIYDLLPFWSDVWQAASGKAGVNALLSHPIYSLLDTFGVAKSLGVFGESRITAAERAGTLSSEQAARLRPLVKPFAEGLARSATRGITSRVPVPETWMKNAYSPKTGPQAANLYNLSLNFLKNAPLVKHYGGLGSDIREDIARPSAQIERKYRRQFHEHLSRIDDAMRKVWGKGYPTAEEQRAIYEEAVQLYSTGDVPNPNSRYAPILTELRDAMRTMTQYNLEAGHIRDLPLFDVEGNAVTDANGKGLTAIWGKNAEPTKLWGAYEKASQKEASTIHRRESKLFEGQQRLSRLAASKVLNPSLIPGFRSVDMESYRLSQLVASVKKDMRAIEEARLAKGRALKAYVDSLHKTKNIAAQFTPHSWGVRSINLQLALEHFQLQDVAEVRGLFNNIEQSWEFNKVALKDLLKENPAFREHWATMEKEIADNWTQWKQQGIDPLFMPNHDIGRLERAFQFRLDRVRNPDPALAYARSKDASFSVMNPIAQISFHIKSTLEHQANLEFYNTVVANPNISVPRERIEALANDAYRRYRETAIVRKKHFIDEKTWKNDFIKNRMGFQDWNPRDIFPFARRSNTMIPGNIRIALETMNRQGQIGAVLDSTMNLFRFSLLGLSPRFDFHIMFGGGTMMMLRAIPQMFYPKTLKMAFDAVNGKTLPVTISEHVVEMGRAQAFQQYLAGRSEFRLAREAHLHDKHPNWARYSPYQKLQTFAHYNQNAMHWVSNMQRAITNFGYMERGLKRGMSIEDAMDAGAHAANKVLSDLDSMTPFERNIMQNLFPFWGWTRHVLRYILTYPIDHPYRTMFISSLANQWQQNYNDLTPQNLAMLFTMGSPNQDGYFSTIDFRQLNPFRTSWNLFTFAGWYSSMNPLITGLGAAAGVNTLDASPELYPTLHFDTFYDINTSTVPVSQRLLSFGSAIVPQLGALSAFVDVSQNLKNLRAYDPQAYQAQIFSMLNLPGIVQGPVQQNIYQIQGKVQERMYINLKTAVDNALTNGDFSGLMQYNQVPYGGQFYTPEQLQQVAQAGEQQYAKEGQPYGPLPPMDVLAPPRSMRL